MAISIIYPTFRNPFVPEGFILKSETKVTPNKKHFKYEKDISSKASWNELPKIASPLLGYSKEGILHSKRLRSYAPILAFFHGTNEIISSISEVYTSVLSTSIS